MTDLKLPLLLACGLALTPCIAPSPARADNNNNAANALIAHNTANALIAQGDQLDSQGDHQGAIEDYGKAIALGNQYQALLDRSVAYANSGHFADAFQDLDHVEALKPNDATPLSIRYWFDFDLYQFPAVIATVDKMNGKQPADPYAPLLRFIAATRLGQNTNTQLAKTLTTTTENQWPQAAAQMFLGKVTPDQLLQWVEDSGNGQASCEAPFYVGEYFMIHNNHQLAQVAFQDTQRDECRPLMEYYAAQHELASLGGETQ